jgi:hypothetical protein
MSSKFKIKSLKFLKQIFKFSNFQIFNLVFFSIFFSIQISKAQFSNNLQSNLKQHISILASDEFEGRSAGSKGEQMAAEYISNQFSKLNLKPAGDSGSYFQKFKFIANAYTGKNTGLYINGKSHKLHSDFYPVSYSGNGKVKTQAVYVGYGITANDLEYDDYKNLSDLNEKVFVMELYAPDEDDPHHNKFADHIDLRKKIELAISHGAKGIIFINSDKTMMDASSFLNPKIFPSEIPVVFAQKKLNKKLKSCKSCEIEINTEIIKPEQTAMNVLAFIDNHAPLTIIIGAHYDHLGWHHAGSLYSKKDSAIHNGADDNASGVAGLIELAAVYKSGINNNNNYLFIAFSGEESGLLGSAHFVESSLFNKEKTNYMLNMDMIGRLDMKEKKLIINGSGTSPVWASLLQNIKVDSLSASGAESGVGPSDHTSFYLKDIPVLHFFSGLHSDYHKPADDEEKINYKGMELILKYMDELIDSLNGKAKISFSKTKDKQAKNTPKFSVTLGVMPDYSFNGKGLKITGVTEDKPAQKAGLIANDIILKIGEYEIADIYSYMETLGKFKKDEKTTIVISRNQESIEFKLEW